MASGMSDSNAEDWEAASVQSGGYNDESEFSEGAVEALRMEEESETTRLLEKLTNTTWCSCGGCYDSEHPVDSTFVKSERELVCCQDSDQARDCMMEKRLFNRRKDFGCIAAHPAFQIHCLYKKSVENFAVVFEQAGAARVPDTKKNLCYAACRAYML